MNFIEEKKRLRAQLRQRRSAIPEDERTQKNVLIHQNLMSLDAVERAETVFCYLAYLSEVETKEILSVLLAHGCTLAVPKIIDHELMVAAPFSGWDELENDRYGILTPVSERSLTGPFDIAITPGLGFTLQGARLGYGRGYYDRWFSKHQVGVKIGLAFEAQLIDEIPTEQTDIAIDILVTENQVVDLRK